MDCVREANRTSRTARTALGGRISASHRPIATITFVAISAALFLAGYVVPIYQWMAFSPAIGQIQPWRMITSAFLHAGWLHLLVNMYALWIVGPFLEQMLGRWRFVALYLLSAFGGSVAVIWLADWGQAVVGASGAVFGIFAAIAVVLRRTGRDARQILIVIGINVVFSLVIARVSWQAHLGGLLVGAAMGFLFAYLPRERRSSGAVIGVAGTAVVLVGLTLLAYS